MLITKPEGLGAEFVVNFSSVVKVRIRPVLSSLNGYRWQGKVVPKASSLSRKDVPYQRNY